MSAPTWILQVKPYLYPSLFVTINLRIRKAVGLTKRNRYNSAPRESRSVKALAVVPAAIQKHVSVKCIYIDAYKRLSNPSIYLQIK